jgi:hypothetical protein
LALSAFGSFRCFFANYLSFFKKWMVAKQTNFIKNKDGE